MCEDGTYVVCHVVHECIRIVRLACKNVRVHMSQSVDVSGSGIHDTAHHTYVHVAIAAWRPFTNAINIAVTTTVPRLQLLQNYHYCMGRHLQ